MESCPRLTCKVHRVSLVCPAGIGAEGGRSQSPAKRKAAHANLKKARKRRWPGKPRKRSITQASK